jgi:hypothetical protein
VNELAPWKWMFEDQVFGVRNPETGETGFVSVMGMGGEHFSIALYPDAAALHAFLRLEEEGRSGKIEVAPERVLEIPQLQASFEDRDYLEKEDRETIKKLDLKFRGANAWPMFRDYSPGFLPWFVSGAEARFLALALEQLLDVAPRVRKDESLLTPTENDKDFLVRVSCKEGSKLVWQDETVAIAEPSPVSIKVTLNPELIEQFKRKPVKDSAIELDVTMLPMPFREKKERPRFPYLMLILDSRAGMIIGTNMLQITTTLADLRADIPNEIGRALANLEAVPRFIVVRSEWLAEALKPLAAELGLKIQPADSLPALEAALDFLSQMPGFGR